MADLNQSAISVGWLNGAGDSEERVYDVVLSDDRTNGSHLVGNSVNLTTGAYSLDIGAGQLRTVWRDPDFEPTQNAFYYARVLEIPTPRYSLLDSIALGIESTATNRPATIQERVYSSPIWYTP